jgi:hypothetical protein
MKIQHPGRSLSQKAMTWVELIVITAMVLLLLAMLMPQRFSTAKPARIKCLNNLKNLGLAYRVFATDHNDKYYPMQLSITNGGSMEFKDDVNSIWRHYLSLSNELSTPKILICPADKGRVIRLCAELASRNEHLVISTVQP